MVFLLSFDLEQIIIWVIIFVNNATEKFPHT